MVKRTRSSTGSSSSSPSYALRKRQEGMFVELMMECCDDELSASQIDATSKAKSEYETALQNIRAAHAAQAERAAAILAAQACRVQQSQQPQLLAQQAGQVQVQSSSRLQAAAAMSAMQPNVPRKTVRAALQAAQSTSQQAIKLVQVVTSTAEPDVIIVGETPPKQGRPQVNPTAVPQQMYKFVNVAGPGAVPGPLPHVPGQLVIRPLLTVPPQQQKQNFVPRGTAIPVQLVQPRRIEPSHNLHLMPGAKRICVVDQSQMKKKPVKRQSVEPADERENWIPLDEYYYGKMEGDPAYVEEKGEYRFKCWYCSKMLYNNVRAMMHIQGHITSGKQQNIDLSDLTQCKYCYKQLDTPFEMQTHMEKVHMNNANVLLCRICEKDHQSRQALAQHMRQNHNAFEMPYICHLCTFRSSMYSDVVDHFKKKHDSSQNLLCLYCLRVFHVKFVQQGWGHTQTFYSHLLKHQSKSSAKKCPTCKLTFLNSQDVKVHKKDHLPNQKTVAGNNAPCDNAAQVMINVPESGQNVKSLNAPTVSKIQDFGGMKMPVVDSELLCFECKTSMGTQDHYKKHIQCSLCRFATSCSFAYATHMMGFHSGQMSSMNLNIPWERAMSTPMYCLCGFGSKYGNKIATHLVYCTKRTCYKDRLEQWVTEDAELSDSKQKPETSLLDVLGLVKKKSIVSNFSGGQGEATPKSYPAEQTTISSHKKESKSPRKPSLRIMWQSDRRRRTRQTEPKSDDDIQTETKLEVNISSETKSEEMDISSETKSEEMDISSQTKLDEVDISSETKSKELIVSDEIKPEEVDISSETKSKEANISSETKSEELIVSDETKPEEVDISSETKLKEVDISSETKSAEVDISSETKSEEVDISSETKSAEVDISSETKSEEVDISSETKSAEMAIFLETKPEEVDISSETKSAEVDISSETKSAEVDISSETKSAEVDISSETKSAEVDISSETKSAEVDISSETKSAEVDISSETKSAEVDISSETKSAEVDISSETKSAEVDISSETKSAEVDISSETKSAEVDISSETKLAEVDISSETKSAEVDISSETKSAEVDISSETKSAEVDISSEIIREEKSKEEEPTTIGLEMTKEEPSSKSVDSDLHQKSKDRSFSPVLVDGGQMNTEAEKPASSDKIEDMECADTVDKMEESLNDEEIENKNDGTTEESLKKDNCVSPVNQCETFGSFEEMETDLVENQNIVTETAEICNENKTAKTDDGEAVKNIEQTTEAIAESDKIEISAGSAKALQKNSETFISVDQEKNEGDENGQDMKIFSQSCNLIQEKADFNVDTDVCKTGDGLADVEMLETSADVLNDDLQNRLKESDEHILYDGIEKESEMEQSSHEDVDENILYEDTATDSGDKNGDQISDGASDTNPINNEKECDGRNEDEETAENSKQQNENLVEGDTSETQDYSTNNEKESSEVGENSEITQRESIGNITDRSNTEETSSAGQAGLSLVSEALIGQAEQIVAPSISSEEPTEQRTDCEQTVVSSASSEEPIEQRTECEQTVAPCASSEELVDRPIDCEQKVDNSVSLEDPLENTLSIPISSHSKEDEEKSSKETISKSSVHVESKNAEASHQKEMSETSKMDDSQDCKRKDHSDRSDHQRDHKDASHDREYNERSRDREHRDRSHDGEYRDRDRSRDSYRERSGERDRYHGRNDDRSRHGYDRDHHQQHRNQGQHYQNHHGNPRDYDRHKGNNYGNNRNRDWDRGYNRDNRSGGYGNRGNYGGGGGYY